MTINHTENGKNNSMGSGATKHDGGALVSVHYHPPRYPSGFFPSRCTHPPEFSVVSDVKLVETASGEKRMESDHSICLACGLSRPSAYGGNVLVDCQMVMRDHRARNVRIHIRVQQLRDKWARIARHLFDENGWNGRHECVARMIDPKLSMKMRVQATGHGDINIASVQFDPSYLRPITSNTEKDDQ